MRILRKMYKILLHFITFYNEMCINMKKNHGYYITYEELKPELWLRGCNGTIGYYITYEELKRCPINIKSIILSTLLHYL
jgi:hypothetical protein